MLSKFELFVLQYNLKMNQILKNMNFLILKINFLVNKIGEKNFISYV